VSESSNTPAEEGQPFDVEQFARETIQSIEYGDAMSSVLEERVIRLEEIVAARWPRRRLLRRRLAREIRASVATWDASFIPRGDFVARRYEAVAQMTSRLPEARRHHAEQTRGWQKHTGWASADRPGGQGAEAGSERPAEGDGDPGAGYLP